jgi:hypothetical protein
LFTHLRLGLHSGLFPSGYPTDILYAFLFWKHVAARMSTYYLSENERLLRIRFFSKVCAECVTNE